MLKLYALVACLLCTGCTTSKETRFIMLSDSYRVTHSAIDFAHEQGKISDDDYLIFDDIADAVEPKIITGLRDIEEDGKLDQDISFSTLKGAMVRLVQIRLKQYEVKNAD